MNNYTFNNINIVMVRPTEAGNIGAVARAMKNMALSKLVLISPKNFPSKVATARASNADDVLTNALIVKNLDEGLIDSNLVIGVSVRQRSNKWQQLDVIQSCARIKKVIQSGGKVSMLFGTENSGLTNLELDYANILMTIPANNEYMSLNVAQAVQVFAYQNFISNYNTKFSGINNLADTQSINSFYCHFEQILDYINYIESNRPRELTLRRIKKIFNKSNLTKQELAMLRGILDCIKPFTK